MESGDGPKEEGGDAKLEEEEEEGGKGEEQKEKPSNTRMMAEESGYNPEIIFNKVGIMSNAKNVDSGWVVWVSRRGHIFGDLCAAINSWAGYLDIIVWCNS